MSNTITFTWKPITEIPTEHWERNDAVSPVYFVKCNGTVDGQSIIGYSRYSFATQRWMKCFNATEPGIWDVIAWTDVKI